MHSAIEQSAQSGELWTPQLEVPKVVVYGLEDFRIVSSLDRAKKAATLAFSEWVLKRAEVIDFPGSDESTLADPSDVFKMGYVGDCLDAADDEDAPTEIIQALNRLYYDVLPSLLETHFGDIVGKVSPLAKGQRRAEVFITHPKLGLRGDPHRDRRLTAAVYTGPGVLASSHCVNARGLQDMHEQPATLAIVRPWSAVLFLGTRFLHTSLDPDILPGDDVGTRRAKVYEMLHTFPPGSKWVQNLYEPDRFGPSDPELGGPDSLRNWLAKLPEMHGFREVISMNFDSLLGGESPLDELFEQVGAAAQGGPRLSELLAANE